MLLYYSRTLRSGQIVRAPLRHVTLLLVLSASLASQTPSNSPDVGLRTDGFTVRDDTFSDGQRPPLPLQFVFHPLSRQHERIITTTKETLRLLGEWLGPYPATRLTLVDAGTAEIGRDTLPEVVVLSSRWIAPTHDLALERSLIAALARAYFRSTDGSGSASRDFENGVAHYLAMRAINQLLDGHQAATFRYFGGFVPVVVRALPLSRGRRDPRPIIRSYDDLDGAASSRAAQRAADALHTLERLIGWPSMQQTLVDFAPDARRGQSTATAFAAIMTRQRGHEMGWFFEDALRTSATFDYGVADVTTTSAQNDDTYATVVTVRRYGDAFPNVDRLGRVVTRFADGTEISEQWDGTVDEASFAYTSRSPAVAAAVDVDAVFLLDTNRTNNSRALHTSFSALAARHAISWMTWLQNLALTYTALV